MQSRYFWILSDSKLSCIHFILLCYQRVFNFWANCLQNKIQCWFMKVNFNSWSNRDCFKSLKLMKIKNHSSFCSSFTSFWYTNCNLEFCTYTSFLFQNRVFKKKIDANKLIINTILEQNLLLLSLSTHMKNKRFNFFIIKQLMIRIDENIDQSSFLLTFKFLTKIYHFLWI